MKPRTTREKWMLALLPVVLTLLLGWAFFVRPADKQLALLKQRVAAQGSAAAKRAQIDRARQERTSLEKTLKARQQAAEAEENTFDRNAAMQEVSALCSACGLSLNKTEQDLTGKLPKNLQEAASALGEGATPPQLWKLEFSGAYPEVIRLLDGLQKARPLIVPLAVSMQSGKTERTPASWVLTLWL